MLSRNMVATQEWRAVVVSKITNQSLKHKS